MRPSRTWSFVSSCARRGAWIPAGILLALGWLPAAIARAQEPDPRYWRLPQIEAALDDWQAQYPDLIYRTDLGSSGQGAAIPLIRISDHAATDEPEPALLFHAAQHANECNGTGAVMRQMQFLLEGYGHDPAVTARVDRLELWFVPILNIDGHGYVFSGASDWASWRKTLRDNDDDGAITFPVDGVDLNRNWDWFWPECDDDQFTDAYYKGPAPWSEPEAAALREFVKAERPLFVVDYHSPDTIGWSNMIFYPWISTHGWGTPPDLSILRSVAQGWAAATRNAQGNPFSSITGYDTLPKEQNWIYGRTGILAFEMEIASECWWTGAVVDTIATRVARGGASLLDRAIAGPGITGRVTDAATGAPLIAEIQLAELHSAHIGPRLTDARFGQYFRLTAVRSYTVTASCGGYDAQTRTVAVTAGQWSTADFALTPHLTPIDADPAAAGPWLRGANPLPAGGRLRLALPAGVAPARADVYDLRGHHLANLGDHLVAGRSHELSLPEALPAGVYLVRVRAGERAQVRRVVRVP